jgi:hypothetical protein
MQHLGRTDPVEHVDTGPLLEALADLGRQRFARRGTEPKRKRLLFREIRIGEQGCVQGRNAIENRRLPFDEPLEHRGGRRALGHQDRRRADREGNDSELPRP